MKSYLALSLFALCAALVVSCDRPALQEPQLAVAIKPYTPPVHENSIIVSIAHRPDHPLGFSIVVGSNLKDVLSLETNNKDDLAEQVVTAMKSMLAKNPHIDTVIFECDGELKQRDVEWTKRLTNPFALKTYISVSAESKEP